MRFMAFSKTSLRGDGAGGVTLKAAFNEVSDGVFLSSKPKLRNAASRNVAVDGAGGVRANPAFGPALATPIGSKVRKLVLMRPGLLNRMRRNRAAFGESSESTCEIVIRISNVKFYVDWKKQILKFEISIWERNSTKNFEPLHAIQINTTFFNFWSTIPKLIRRCCGTSTGGVVPKTKRFSIEEKWKFERNFDKMLR